jgi:hypothetical protein
VKAELLPLFFLAWGLAPGMAQTDLMTVYQTVRPVLCLMLGKTTNCPLPDNIVLPSSEAEVQQAVAQAKEIFSIGTAKGLPRSFFDSLARRAVSGQGLTVNWAGLKEDKDFLERWMSAVNPQKGTLTLNVLTVPETDATRAITRTPFVGIDDRVYLYVLGGWYRLDGEIVRQVYAVLRNGAVWLARAASREAAIEAKDAALKKGGTGK